MKQFLLGLGLGIAASLSMQARAEGDEFKFLANDQEKAYCAREGGYVANDNKCYIGTPETCGPSSPSTTCVDAIPEFGYLLDTCSCD